MDRPEDIVRDILDRLHEAFQGKATLDASFWIGFEDEIRQHWGGELQYIAKTSEAQIRYKSQRDRSIVRDWQRGEHAKFLARRYGISERHVRRIISGQCSGHASP